MTSPPPIIAGRYRVLRELGRGGMGVVYVVEHVGTGDHLALKLLINHAGASAELIERFKREAKAPAKIKSQHVVKVTDADVAPEMGGAPFMVMELLDGNDLEKTLAALGSVPPQDVVRWLRQAASALDKAHALGITHRDLKPENLFLHRRDDGDPIIKILDFGISKMSGEAANDLSQVGLTQSGAMMGTPLYMSPEQARGRVAELGPATDVWAMGLIAHRLLTGGFYWQAHTLAELMVQIISDPMPPPSTREPWLPPAFDAWFARSTNRDPKARFATVGEQIAALSAALGSTSETASNPSGEIVPPATLLASPSLPVVGAHTTGAGLASSSIGRPTAARRSLLPMVLAIAAVVGFGGGLAMWKLNQGGAEPAPVVVPASDKAKSKEPRELHPIETASSEPASPEPVVSQSAAYKKPEPTPPTSKPSAAPLASAPRPNGAKSAAPVVAPQPAPPPATAPPEPVTTVKKKYDPAAP